MTKIARAAGWGGVALVVALAACTREPPKREPTPLDRATVGAITGEVHFTGTPPAETLVDMSSAKDCATQHAQPNAVPAGDVLVHDGKVQNAIVRITEGLGDRVFAVPDTPVIIDQEKCLFVPRVAAAQVDQPIRFLNSDALPHNVHGTPAKASGWNFSLGLKGAARTVELAQPEDVVPIKCDIHPWMKAHLGVYAHPYFAVTGADGKFALADVPPGTYTIEAWHERFGTRSATVTLGPKETKPLTFEFVAK